MSFSVWETDKICNVADVQTGPFGSQLHNSDYVETGTPIITVEHLGKRRLSRDSMPSVCEEDRVRLNKYSLKTGDLVFSRVGSVDRCSLVGNDENGWLFSGRCLRVRPNTNFLYSNYLYYYFCLENMKEYIRSIAVGATMPSINTKILSEVKITLPQITVQKAIADTLSCLDDKIELNNRMNKTLEEMAQAIFKSWFVDFEPFQDGEFEDSELGRIPKGWRVGTISDLGDIIGGSTPTKARDEYYTEKGMAWITPKDLSNNKDKFISKGAIDITDLGLKNSSTKIMPKGTVLFSSRAPIGYIAIAKNNCTTNQGFKSVVPKSNIGTAYVYCFLKDNIDVIENRASGSTFMEVSGSVMKQIPALIPSDSVLMKFQNICSLYFNQQMLLENQNKSLTTIRDSLLPELMSGEIRVPIVEVQ